MTTAVEYKQARRGYCSERLDCLDRSLSGCLLCSARPAHDARPPQRRRLRSLNCLSAPLAFLALLALLDFLRLNLPFLHTRPSPFPATSLLRRRSFCPTRSLKVSLHDSTTRNDDHLPLTTILDELHLQHPSCHPFWCVSPPSTVGFSLAHNLFSIIFCGAAAVAAWSLIVLGIALHFQTAFVSSDARTYSYSTSIRTPQSESESASASDRVKWQTPPRFSRSPALPVSRS